MIVLPTTGQNGENRYRGEVFKHSIPAESVDIKHFSIFDVPEVKLADAEYC